VGEGFIEVVRASTEVEIEAAFEKCKALIELPIVEEGWSAGQGRAKGRGPGLKKSAHVTEDEGDMEKTLNSSGGKGKGVKGKEGKLPDVIAYNPFDMLTDNGDVDDDNDE